MLVAAILGPAHRQVNATARTIYVWRGLIQSGSAQNGCFSTRRAFPKSKREKDRGGGKKRGPACHRSPSAEPMTEKTVKTCAVLTPRLAKA